MATSSIFHNIKITDAETADKFIKALEESEKAQRTKKTVQNRVKIAHSPEEIHKVMAKRFEKK